jgi:PD-(D/E)XK nuclease superfamily protein
VTTPLYTSSRLRVIRECLRKHHLRYIEGLQTPPTDVMRFGTIGHAALEAYLRVWRTAPRDTEYESSDAAEVFGIEHDRVLAARLSAALTIIDTSDLSPWDRIKLRLLVIAYHDRWGTEPWEILAVEQEFDYWLGDKHIAGKIDAIIRNRADGRIYVLEHKFTGSETSLGGPYWERLTIDTQVSIYIDGAAMLGYDISGCIYDVIKRPGHEPKLATPIEKREYTKGKGCKGCGGSGGGKAGIIQGRGVYIVAGPGEEQREIQCTGCSGTGWLNDAEGKPQAPRLHSHQRDTDETGEAFEERLVEAIAEAPDAFLLRGTVTRLDAELPAMRQDVLDDIAVAETGLQPRNPDACARYGAMCAYWTLCSGTATTDDFMRGPAHPEPEVAI